HMVSPFDSRFLSASYDSIVPLLLFFYTYRDHPDLHSFPTRRSSDLINVPVRQLDVAGDGRLGLQGRDGLVHGIVGFFVFRVQLLDRKSTRLNSSHLGISYAVFCLKKKKPSFAFSAAVPALHSDTHVC